MLKTISEVDFLQKVARLAVRSAEQQFKAGLINDRKGYTTDFVTNSVSKVYSKAEIDGAIESAVWIEGGYARTLQLQELT